jgi:hypothetical protein
MMKLLARESLHFQERKNQVQLPKSITMIELVILLSTTRSTDGSFQLQRDYNRQTKTSR